MGKYLQKFLEGEYQKRGDKGDKGDITILNSNDASLMSPKSPVLIGGISTKDENVCEVRIHSQQAIDIPTYIDFYEERAAIYEFEAYDAVKSRLEAERLVLKDTLVKFIDDQQIQLQPEQVADFLQSFGEIVRKNEFMK